MLNILLKLMHGIAWVYYTINYQDQYLYTQCCDGGLSQQLFNSQASCLQSIQKRILWLKSIFVFIIISLRPVIELAANFNGSICLIIPIM